MPYNAGCWHDLSTIEVAVHGENTNQLSKIFISNKIKQCTWDLGWSGVIQIVYLCL